MISAIDSGEEKTYVYLVSKHMYMFFSSPLLIADSILT